MSRRRIGVTRIILFLAVILVSVVLVGRAMAQSGGGYDLSWWTVDGGGDSLSGGSYTMVGIVSQPEVGEVLAGGNYALAGGFLPGFNIGFGGGGDLFSVYLPIIIKNQ